ncbi:MAG: hypothetical protein JXA90_12620 [Planctomycetes bacterium]|nr:hypothetical protein [Planctomycetota bacterium]
MNRSLMFIVCLIAVALVSSTAGAQATFDLTLSGPASLTGAAESVVQYDVDGILVPGGLTAEDKGAQGWSVSLIGEGCTIIDVTTAGTVAAKFDDDPPGLWVGGFNKTQTTDGVGSVGACLDTPGAVSAIVLSFTLDVTLDPVNPSTIVKLVVEAPVPAIEDPDNVVCAAATVAYVDGCTGAGQPVDNKVTHMGGTVIPSLGLLTTEICPVLDCSQAPINLIFQGEASLDSETLKHQVEALFDNSLADDPGPADPEANLEVATAPGETGQAEGYVAIVSQLGDTGRVQGWSLSLAATGLTMVEATTTGTIAASAETDPAGIWVGGFNKTQIVDPLYDPDDETGMDPPGENGPLPPQGEGCVSAIVLSFTLDITLEPVGTATVLKFAVAAAEATPDEGSVSGLMTFKDGLKGAGQPVNNVATVSGGTASFCQPKPLVVSFVPVQVGSFKTSDANGDAKIDIADPIYVINHLFREGPDFPCPASADANDDDMVDISDAAHVIQYLFMAGDAPIGDIECHIDETLSPEDCPAGSTACDA